jgi:hypothetical protein
MPQAKSGGARSTSRSRSTSGTKRTSSAKSTSGRSQTKRSTSSGSASRARSTRAGASRSSGSTSTARATSAKSTAGAADARLDAVAQRLRKLNERIIEAGKEAGETTLTNYEKALKAIASTIEKGPGSSEIDWISNMATAQAKFIRDVTTAWTSAARDRLK